MSTVETKLAEYKTLTTSITDYETKIAEAKKARSALAKSLKDEHGEGPYELDGKTVNVASMKDSYFLRAPLVPPARKKKDATIAS
jgi:hypothetical protein